MFKLNIYCVCIILFSLRVNLNIYHKDFYNTKHNTNSVCILVQHFILFTIECRMIFSMAIYKMFIVYKCLSTKKIIGGPSFHSSIMMLISGSIFMGDSPMIVVSPYS